MSSKPMQLCSDSEMPATSTRSSLDFLFAMLRIAGFVIPVIPLWRTLKDQNKRFFTFVERPLMGIPADLVGTAAARMVASVFLGNVNPVGFWHNFTEIYCSYQSANLVRNGVNVDERLSDKIKVRLNYLYSVLIYSTFTAAGKFAGAGDPKMLVAALAEVGYAILWPLMSQHVATYIIIPVMFGRFAKKDFLDQLRSPDVSTSALQPAIEAEAHGLDAIIAGNHGHPIAVRAKHELQHKMRWLEFFRKGLADNAPTPMRRFIAYWFIKTAVSVGMSSVMIALYFTMRFVLVGFGGYTGPLSGLMHLVLSIVGYKL